MNRTALYRFGDGSPDVAQLLIVAKALLYPSIFTACRLLLGGEDKEEEKVISLTYAQYKYLQKSRAVAEQ
eukprot:14107332-Ditylum_brightwellii.AAC.1